jgi:hypothetical protein
MAEALCCPVSLEEFRDPRVLPCGHTIDLFSIPANRVLRACPLCRAVLGTTLENCPVNWTVVSFMGLEVVSDTIETRYGTRIRTLVQKIRRRVAKHASLRYHASVFLRCIPENDREAVQNRLSTELRDAGFVVTETKILMSEGCLCTSIREDLVVVVVPK